QQRREEAQSTLAKRLRIFVYHMGYSRDDVKQIFHDVKFVVMGGSANRMGSFAELIAKEIGVPGELAETLVKLQDDKTFNTIFGTTMCTDDFYEGQARVDGAFCDLYFTEEDRIKYLHELQGNGVVNIEMEATLWLLFTLLQSWCEVCHFCVTLLDRLQGDQVEITEETYKKFVFKVDHRVFVRTFILTKLKEQELEEN
ncbi:LOW QUALITY PROTEIN: uridine and thymidine phosphorylase-like, partial [Gigantopelta aegis]|uniref:LOW QUALITY PROTEIN: uridine and thymidine phosphorylase-like n=1 Tax=Gigantopelta aegis TaxID=1735272 RepID=UPI001B88A7D2